MDDGRSRLERIVEPAIRCRRRHELSDALRTFGANGLRIEAALLPDQTHEQHGRQTPGVSLLLHQRADRVDERLGGRSLSRGNLRSSFRAIVDVVASRWWRRKNERREQRRRCNPRHDQSLEQAPSAVQPAEASRPILREIRRRIRRESAQHAEPEQHEGQTSQELRPMHEMLRYHRLTQTSSPK